MSAGAFSRENNGEAMPPLRRHARRLPDPRADDLPLDADPPERRRTAVPLAGTLEGILRRYRLPHAGRMDTVLRLWPQIAGDDLAGRARPGKCDRGILFLYVRSSAELFELRRFALRRLESRLRSHPELSFIRQVRLLIDPGDTGG